MFWCIFAYFQTTRIMSLKKIFFKHLEWLKTCFDAFAHTPRPPEIFVKKRNFYCLEWLKTYFNAFSHTSSPPETFFKKDIFDRLEWLKTCFVPFSHTPRPPKTCFQKRYYWTSGAIKNLFWCIFAYFQTTRIMSLKKIFFNIWSG